MRPGDPLTAAEEEELRRLIVRERWAFLSRWLPIFLHLEEHKRQDRFLEASARPVRSQMVETWPKSRS